MAEIIKLATFRKKPADKKVTGDLAECPHKNVVVYEKYRSVHCAICRALLDPFEVLVDMMKRHVPPGGETLEESRLNKEAARRERDKKSK